MRLTHNVPLSVQLVLTHELMVSLLHACQQNYIQGTATSTVGDNKIVAFYQPQFFILILVLCLTIDTFHYLTVLHVLYVTFSILSSLSLSILSSPELSVSIYWRSTGQKHLLDYPHRVHSAANINSSKYYIFLAVSTCCIEFCVHCSLFNKCDF